MNIGYACIAIGVKSSGIKSCLLKNASWQRLEAIIGGNLTALENIIDYNIKNRIKLFRISSELIPFGGTAAALNDWRDLFAARLAGLGQKARAGGVRLSVHPGQYTVLNSPDAQTVDRAIKDLEYHFDLLDLLKTAPDARIILHIGGGYGDKKSAAERFIESFRRLDGRVRRRIAVENDDRIFNIKEVLDIGERLGAPVVYDTLHNMINPFSDEADAVWIERCAATWGPGDGAPKIHYSQQEAGKRAGSHSATVRAAKFLEFINGADLSGKDIMLEVKDKNLSAVKCIKCVYGGSIDGEWKKYRLSVLERDPEAYLRIDSLVKPGSGAAVEFYTLLEEALSKPVLKEHAAAAALAAWGLVQTEEKESRFNKLLERENLSLSRVKNFLYAEAIKYQSEDLLNSYYFVL